MPDRIDLKTLPYKQLVEAAKSELNVRDLNICANNYHGVQLSEILSYWEVRVGVSRGVAFDILLRAERMGYLKRKGMMDVVEFSI